MKKIVCTKSFSEEELEIIKRLSIECGITEDTAAILFARGYDSADKLNAYLNPSLSHLHDPFLFENMKRVCNRIAVARDNGEAVLVYGDYDADGICASTVLYNCLKKFGVKAYTTVPNRDDGYGLNKKIVDRMRDRYGVSLIITVDCGISDRTVISEIQSEGIEVIVTDHHEAPPALPECIIINPKCDKSYPFSGLCGAGVAYKLATALIGADAHEYLDFVALATVADSMELKNENRDIVYEGLKIFNAKRHKQFFYLLPQGKPVTAQTLAYTLAPKINAPGRMGDALCALEFFLASLDDKLQSLSAKVIAYNMERQAECEKLYKEAKAMLANISRHGNIIMLYNEQWGTGFVGIVASKLAEEYGLPVILFAGLDGNLKGSARSVEGINLYEAVSSAADLLIEYGGHAQAVGVAVTKEKFYAFYERVDLYIRNNFVNEAAVPTVYIEKYFDSEIDIKFAYELEKMEPTGVENRKPLFAVKAGRLNVRPMRADSPHVTFRTRAIEMLNFNGLANIPLLNSSFRKDIVFEINCSSYAGRDSVKGIVKEILADSEEYAEICAFEHTLKNRTEFDRTLIIGTDLSYGAFADVYHILCANTDKKYRSAAQFYVDNRINTDLKQFIICANVFFELGFFGLDNGILTVIKGIRKKLDESDIYKMVTG